MQHQFKSQSQIDIWILGCGYNVENRKCGQATNSTKEGADKLAKNTPNVPNLSAQFPAQAKQFGISMKKKALLAVCNPWFESLFFFTEKKFWNGPKIHMSAFFSI